jgi:hypothetical protein
VGKKNLALSTPLAARPFPQTLFVRALLSFPLKKGIKNGLFLMPFSLVFVIP